jgi:hypothetical protein
MSLRAGLDYFVGCILFLFSCFLFFFFSLLMCKLFLWLFSMISRVRHLGCVVPPHIKFTAVKDWIRIRGVKPEFNRKDLHLRQTQVSVKLEIERERGGLQIVMLLPCMCPIPFHHHFSLFFLDMCVHVCVSVYRGGGHQTLDRGEETGHLS